MKTTNSPKICKGELRESVKEALSRLDPCSDEMQLMLDDIRFMIDEYFERNDHDDEIEPFERYEETEESIFEYGESYERYI